MFFDIWRWYYYGFDLDSIFDYEKFYFFIQKSSFPKLIFKDLPGGLLGLCWHTFDEIEIASGLSLDKLVHVLSHELIHYTADPLGYFHSPQWIVRRHSPSITDNYEEIVAEIGAVMLQLEVGGGVLDQAFSRQYIRYYMCAEQLLYGIETHMLLNRAIKDAQEAVQWLISRR